MYLPLSKKIKLTPKRRQLLQNLMIDKNQPGSLLRDFEMLLNLIREQKIFLTAGHQLPLRVLTDINSRLAYPLELGLQRPVQKSYPPIHGLYLLVRASGLTYVDETGTKPRLVLDENVYQSWTSLNPTERYCVLLESWLLRGKAEIVGEHWSRLWLIPNNFHSAAYFRERIPDDGLVIAGNKDAEDLLTYHLDKHNLGLMELFGLIRIERGTPVPGQGWQIERVYRTPVGDALLAALYEGFFEDIENVFRLEDEGDIPVGVLQPVLQPHFPAWKNNLSGAEWTFREGAYYFKVSLDKVWRRISIGGQHLLDSFAEIILTAFDFDNDHLYQFSYRDRFGAMRYIDHPYLEDGPFTSEVRIGEVPLSVGQTMIYLFDFGDHWEFDVTLEQVNANETCTHPHILESVGDAPEQYPNWDEGEELDFREWVDEE